MNIQDDLLEYYRRELACLRVQGADFAGRYPRVAHRLAFDGAESPDPHTERLLESFAFLTARIHRELDREFPVVAEALLDNLCPSLTQPIPSMSVVQMVLDPAQGKVTAGMPVRRGTLLSTTAATGENCRFRTAWDVALWPLRVQRVRLEDERSLCLDLVGEPGCDMADLSLESLRFHLAGDVLVTMPLHDMLLTSLEQVWLHSADGAVHALGAGSWCQAGFEAGQEVLPQPAHAHPAYGLLQEYFCFPRKFLFFDLQGLRGRLGRGSAITVRLVFDRTASVLSRLTADHFLLGCVPVINLFELTAEPLRIDQRQHEYRLVPDIQRESMTEVHSVLGVTLSDTDASKPVTVPSVYAQPHAVEGCSLRWVLRREASLRQDIVGTDVFLGLVDLEQQAWPATTRLAHVRTLCTNRRLAEQVPAGARLHAEGVSSTTRIHCLYQPVAQRPAVLGSQALWSLVSLLRLNHGSLLDGSQGLQNLRQMLMLFAGDSAREQAQVRGIVGLRARPAVAQVGHEVWRGHCRGTDVWVDFEDAAFVGGSAVLLSAVLARFLAMYTSVNSFVRLCAMRGDEPRKAWPALAGRQCLV